MPIVGPRAGSNASRRAPDRSRVRSLVMFRVDPREGYPAPMRLITLPGVFRPRSDSRLLARVLCAQDELRGADVLELGTGGGAIAIAAALGGARSVTVVDVSRRALLVAGCNARVNGVRLRRRRGDLFAPVAGERFDVVVSNPPYLPGGALPRRGAARAWEGGVDGRALIERISARAAEHLRPGGVVLLVHSSVNGLRPTLDAFARGGLRADVAARASGPPGPLLAARLPRLREEELLVVRGRRSG